MLSGPSAERSTLKPASAAVSGIQSSSSIACMIERGWRASERAMREGKRTACRSIVEGLRREGAGVRKYGAVCFDFGCVTSPAERLSG